MIIKASLNEIFELSEDGLTVTLSHSFSQRPLTWCCATDVTPP